MKGHVSLGRSFPILLIPDLCKPRQGCPDRLGIGGALTDGPDRFKFDEPPHSKDVGDVLDREATDPCAPPRFTLQESVRDESLDRNAGSWPGHAQLFGYVAVLDLRSR